jgi:hypothetical protein
VQLAHEFITVPREGKVDFNFNYNKYNKNYIFEVFLFYSEKNVHVFFGMDILSKHGIEITGLVSRHGFQTDPKMPDLINASIEPNSQSFGNKKENLFFYY